MSSSAEPAFSAEHLVELIEANEFGPSINEEMAERIIDIARRRTQARGSNPMEQEKDVLVFTNWDNFCRDTFGSSGTGSENVPNRFALCVPNFDASTGRKAWLCEEAVAIQQDWLETEDGRKTQIELIDQSDTDYVNDPKTFWSPKDYTAMVGFGNELVKEKPSAADAM